MTNEEFDALVSRLEQHALNQPGTYKLKVWLLAILGNAYLGAMLGLIVGLLGALLASVFVLKALAVKMIIVVGFFLWIVLRALWVKIEPPVGTEIEPTQAPELFAMIDELRHQLQAPHFHHVLITDEFNAGVVQSPRMGIFGWFRNYLLIGLPLMKSLTIEQFKAVLAHEFGHLAKGHGRMSNWIYRQRLRWSRLLHALEAHESKGSFLFRPFLKWFAPYFSAYAFPMARANEYEADATSVRLTSPQAAAEALTSVNVVGSYLAERYWPKIHKLADDQPQPGFAPYSGMGQLVATEIDEKSTSAWLDQAMTRQTTSDDTHPALSDRLKAIGESPRLTLPLTGHTADQLLGGALESITESFDARWKDGILPSWEERYRTVQENRRQLADLNTQFESGRELSAQEAYDRARLTETVGGNADDALEQLRALHERVPEDALVCLSLGARLLNRDDESGCALVESAMQYDDSAIASGCETLRDYHWRNGRKDQANAWHQRLIERLEIEQAAEKERSEVTVREKFEPHGLSDEMLAELRKQLATVQGLRKAYLVKKRVAHFEHRPCYVFGYRVGGLLRLHSKKRVEKALQQIQESVQFPSETLIINVEGDNYRFGRKFSLMRGSRIF